MFTQKEYFDYFYRPPMKITPITAHERFEWYSKWCEYVAQEKALRKELPLYPGVIYEDCKYHPIRCIEVDWNGDHVIGKSLLDKREYHCSITSCVGEILNSVQAGILIRRYKKGLFPYDKVELSNWTDEDYVENDRQWQRLREYLDLYI